MPTRKKVTKLVLLSLASVLASLMVVELLLHAFGNEVKLSQPSYLTSRFRVIDRDLIMIPKQYLEEAHYKTTDGAEVIVTLGDSFTRGYPVRAKEVLLKQM